MADFKTLVLYRSKHGTTKRYAEWIGDALNGDVMPAYNRNFSEWSGKLQEYDVVIFGGNVNAQGINGIKDMKAAVTKYQLQNVIYFCVGSYPASEDTVAVHRESNFSTTERDQVRLYYFRGRLDFIGLGFLEKRIMGGLMKAIEKKYPEDRTEIEAELLEAYYDDVDWSSKTYIQPLVEEVKSMMTPAQREEVEKEAAVRMAERERLEAEEEAAWEEEMQRREELHQDLLDKKEEEKLKRMSKKQRQLYQERKAREAALAEDEEDRRLLAGEDLPE